MKQSKYQQMIQFSLAFLILSFSATSCNAQSRLLALSKADHTLAIIDPVTLKILARVPVGSDPHEVIASSDGKTAYVSIYGGGSLHELNIIDIVAKKPLKTIDTRPLFGPHGLTFINGKLWFTAEGSKAVGRYDPATEKFDWCMGTGQDRTHMIYVAPDGKMVCTANVSSGTISILTESAKGNREDWSQIIIPTGKGTEGFDVSPDGKELWAAASDDGKISIIDLATKKVTATIDAKVFGANRLKFTRDGKMVFIASLGSGALTIYDAKTKQQIKQLKIGSGAAGIVMDPNGSRAFVACSPDNYIAIINLKTLEVTGHLDVGKNPDGLAWATQN